MKGGARSGHAVLNPTRQTSRIEGLSAPAAEPRLVFERTPPITIDMGGPSVLARFHRAPPCGAVAECLPARRLLGMLPMYKASPNETRAQQRTHDHGRRLISRDRSDRPGSAWRGGQSRSGGAGSGPPDQRRVTRLG